MKPPHNFTRHLHPLLLGLLLGNAMLFPAHHCQAATESPGWQEPAAALRLLFRLPREREFACVQLPAEKLGNATISALDAYHKSAKRPLRLVATNDSCHTLLVDCRNLPPRSEIAIYVTTNQVPLSPDTSFNHSTPIHVTLRQAGANEAPPTWEQMRFMASHPRPLTTFLLAGIAPLNSPEDGPRKWYQASWKRPTYTARLRSRLLITQAGNYRLALKSPTPAWLVLNDQLVASNNLVPPRDNSEWVVSEPLPLTPGLHHYELYTLVERSIDLQAGWQPPGTPEITPIPTTAFIDGHPPVALRYDYPGAQLRVGAAVNAEPAYTFHQRHTTFTPLRLRSLHAPTNDTVGCTWQLGDKWLGGTPRCRVIVTNTGPVEVTLTVTNSAGDSQQASAKLALDPLPLQEYRLASRLAGLPPYGYDDDPIQPGIELRGTTPATLPLTVTLRLTSPAGEITTQREVIKLERGWGRLAMPPTTLHRVASLAWEITHADVVIDAGRTDLLRQPFNRLPEAAANSLLTIAGQSTILVANRASSGHPAPFTPLAGGEQLVLLDGFLLTENHDAAVASRFDELLLTEITDRASGSSKLARESLRYRRHALREVLSDDSASPALLNSLTALRQILPADLVVVAPDIRGTFQGEDIAHFERRLTTLIALLHDVVTPRIVLLTPPPGMVIPGDTTSAIGGYSDPMRAYAVVIQRIADVHGVAVADLHSASYTNPPDSPVTADGHLTLAGHQLAAATLARLLGGN